MARISTSSSGGNVNIQDTNGNPLTSTGGALNVNIGGVSPSQNSVLVYNAEAAVAVGITTTVVTYTAPAGPIVACLLAVSVSGQNVAQWTVTNSASGIYDQNYTSAAALNEVFDFKTGSTVVPGQVIGAGNTITVSVNQIGTSAANFNARLQVLEIG